MQSQVSLLVEAKGDFTHTEDKAMYHRDRPGTTSQGMLAATSSWERQGMESPLEHPQGAWLC